MKRKLTVKKARARQLAWDQPCGCPLYEQLKTKGFLVKRVDSDDWTDVDGKKHKLNPPFTLWRYTEVLSTGQSFVTETSDD